MFSADENGKLYTFVKLIDPKGPDRISERVSLKRVRWNALTQSLPKCMFLEASPIQNSPRTASCVFCKKVVLWWNLWSNIETSLAQVNSAPVLLLLELLRAMTCV